MVEEEQRRTARVDRDFGDDGRVEQHAEKLLCSAGAHRHEELAKAVATVEVFDVAVVSPLDVKETTVPVDPATAVGLLAGDVAVVDPADRFLEGGQLRGDVGGADRAERAEPGIAGEVDGGKQLPRFQAFRLAST